MFRRYHSTTTQQRNSDINEVPVYHVDTAGVLDVDSDDDTQKCAPRPRSPVQVLTRQRANDDFPRRNFGDYDPVHNRNLPKSCDFRCPFPDKLQKRKILFKGIHPYDSEHFRERRKLGVKPDWRQQLDEEYERKYANFTEDDSFENNQHTNEFPDEYDPRRETDQYEYYSTIPQSTGAEFNEENGSQEGSSETYHPVKSESNWKDEVEIVSCGTDDREEYGYETVNFHRRQNREELGYNSCSFQQKDQRVTSSKEEKDQRSRVSQSLHNRTASSLRSVERPSPKISVLKWTWPSSHNYTENSANAPSTSGLGTSGCQSFYNNGSLLSKSTGSQARTSWMDYSKGTGFYQPHSNLETPSKPHFNTKPQHIEQDTLGSQGAAMSTDSKFGGFSLNKKRFCERIKDLNYMYSLKRSPMTQTDDYYGYQLQFWPYDGRGQKEVVYGHLKSTESEAIDSAYAVGLLKLATRKSRKELAKDQDKLGQSDESGLRPLPYHDLQTTAISDGGNIRPLIKSQPSVLNSSTMNSSSSSRSKAENVSSESKSFRACGLPAKTASPKKDEPFRIAIQRDTSLISEQFHRYRGHGSRKFSGN